MIAWIALGRKAENLSKLNVNEYDACIVGLGYVGLTLAVAMCDAGLKVLGVEKNERVVDLLKRGVPHFTEVGMSNSLHRVVSEGTFVVKNDLEESDVSDYFVITVGTPLGANGKPRNDFIINAAEQVAARIRGGDTVIIRSTVSVGTTNHLVRPILQKKNKDINVAMCPERTLEGNAMKELRELPQIIGADDAQSRDRSEALFRHLTNKTVHVSSCEAAEVVKLIDNTFRDVSFAFGNEVARICEALNVSASEIIRAGKFGYNRTNVAMPGLVGGPCLEKDPHILMSSVENENLQLEITNAARKVNERQPKEIVGQIKTLCARLQVYENPTIVLAGMAFKGVPETDDLRGSMSLHLLDLIKAEFNNSIIRLHDPVVSKETLSALHPECETYASLEDAICSSDILIIANNHSQLSSIHPKSIKSMMNERSFIFDVWNHFSETESWNLQDFYYPLGSVKFVLKGTRI